MINKSLYYLDIINHAQLTTDVKLHLKPFLW